MAVHQDFTEDELLSICFELLQRWSDGLISQQYQEPGLPGLNGGIICPACSRIHGRIGYAIEPFMLLAEKNRDQRYLDAALGLYEWMEGHVSLPDGSWVNDVNVSLWKGITVNTAVSLAEAMIQHGHILENRTYAIWKDRLIKASGYLYDNFSIYTGNINYPATCSYALSLIGEFLDIKKYKIKGRLLGEECKSFFSEQDKLLFGEGKPQRMISPKGCRFVDLCYNVEESLPSLVLYGKLVQDEEMLDLLTVSLKAHAEFMLPDGAWDNSWGTRSFKWSYWGGTTSDGCQHAYALLANRDPVFYMVALQNAILLKECTHDNHLYGGLHTRQHGLFPCNHPGFTHLKSMSAVLQHADEFKKIKRPPIIELPRSNEYGVREFKDVHTWLISKGEWRATITGNDMDYEENAGGHPTGGALSMLWHEKAGPVFTASMNRYQLIEEANMQMHKDEVCMPLTPRMELEIEGEVYSNIYDKEAEIRYNEENDEIVFMTYSRLINEEQEDPPEGPINCMIVYRFRENEVYIDVTHNADHEGVKYIAPLISENKEKLIMEGNNKIRIIKDHCEVSFESNQSIQLLKTAMGRIFNHVPGMEAIPVGIYGLKIEMRLCFRVEY